MTWTEWTVANEEAWEVHRSNVVCSSNDGSRKTGNGSADVRSDKDHGTSSDDDVEDGRKEIETHPKLFH